MQIPEYTDGCLRIFDVEHDETTDFPVEKLIDRDEEIWFREIAVFDRLKYELSQGGKEVTMKVRIPRYKGIDSTCAVKIEGIVHVVFNAAHVFDKNGFPETELTLVRPGRELIIS